MLALVSVLRYCKKIQKLDPAVAISYIPGLNAMNVICYEVLKNAKKDATLRLNKPSWEECY